MQATLIVNDRPCTIMHMMHECGPDIWETDDITTGTLRRTNSPVDGYSKKAQHAFDAVEVDFVTECDPYKIAAHVEIAGKTFDRIVSINAESAMMTGGMLVSMRLAAN